MNFKELFNKEAEAELQARLKKEQEEHDRELLNAQALKVQLPINIRNSKELYRLVRPVLDEFVKYANKIAKRGKVKIETHTNRVVPDIIFCSIVQKSKKIPGFWGGDQFKYETILSLSISHDSITLSSPAVRDGIAISKSEQIFKQYRAGLENLQDVLANDLIEFMKNQL